MAMVQHKPESGGSRRNYFLYGWFRRGRETEGLRFILSRFKEKQEEQNTDAGGEKSQQEEFQEATRLSP
jgi:hypothetical protein